MVEKLLSWKHNSLCVLPRSLPRTGSTQEDSVNVSTGYIVYTYGKDKWYILWIEESCANGGEHTEHSKQFQESYLYFITWCQSSRQLLDGLPFSTLKIPVESLHDGLTLSLVCFPGPY